MSKLMDAVIAEFTGERKPHLINMLDIKKCLETAPMPMNDLRAYSISASYSAVGYCETKDLPHVIENFTKGFKRDAYSTIVDDFIRLERAMYQEDLESMRSIMRDIWTEIKP